MDDTSPYKIDMAIDDKDVELGDVVGVIIRYRWLVIAIALATLIFGTVYSYTAAPIYLATALLQVEDKKSTLGEIDMNDFFGGDTSISAEIELLRSRFILGDVIDNLDLDIVAEPDYPFIFGAALARRAAPDRQKSIRVESLEVPTELTGQPLSLIAKPGGSFQLTSLQGEPLVNGTVGEVAVATFAGERLSIFVSILQADPGDVFRLRKQWRLEAVEQLRRSLKIGEQGQFSGILAMTLKSEKPEDAVRILNEIADVYVRKNVERKSAEAEQTSIW